MAKRRIVISEYDNIAALMEEDRAVEFIIHRGDMLLGDVYLATVENILPSIDAAFVNVGGDKMGFLHSSDVPGKGDLKERLEPKQQLVVQIMKEPTGHKGPRVSTSISLPGRFLVMMPDSKGISISRKIQEVAERSRLKSIVSLIKPPGVGVIIRTEANNQKESDITEDFETLLERWQNIVSMADTAQPPTLLYRDQDLLYRVIRESVTEDVNELIVDSAFGLQRAQQLLQNWNMDKNIKVTQYQGTQPILVGTGVDKEIKQALQTKVPLPSGGYLYIQPTEALTVVDVNSGKFTSLASQAETIKLTNLEACKEIARQLRLRNIGGMIIVDFIDMESRANQLTVLQSFENELAPDKSKPQIGQLSDLGLVEMTRHRQGQSLSEIFTKRCPSCHGTGHAPEEFTWMHNSMDPDNRNRGGRNKLPTKGPNRNQPVPKLHNQRQPGKQRIALGQAIQETTQGRKEALATVTPGNILLGKIAESRRSDAGPDSNTLAEQVHDKLQKTLGVKLAAVAKLSFMPMGINNVLARINPKANDIVTLVHSIEAAASMPMHMPAFADEDDFDREDEDESPRGFDEDVVLETDEAVAEEEVDAVDEEEAPRRGRKLPARGKGRPAKPVKGEDLDSVPVIAESIEAEALGEDAEDEIDRLHGQLLDSDEADLDDELDAPDGLDSLDDETDASEDGQSAVAVAQSRQDQSAAAKRRRGGRPTKRTKRLQ